MWEETITNGDDNVLSPINKNKGGFKASSFIFVLLVLENMGFVANAASLFLYFMGVMNFDLSGSANTLTNFLGSTFLLTVVGGFISDTYLSRYTTSLLFGVLEVAGLVMMTIQGQSTHLHSQCLVLGCGVQGRAAWMLFASLSVYALGAGGAKGALPALGGDQFDKNDPKEAKGLAAFFNWLLLSTVLGASVGVTAIVWVSMEKGWWKGFLISTGAAFVGYVVLGLGKRYFRLDVPVESPLLRVAEVIVVAIKNRRLPLPENSDELYEVQEKRKVSIDERIKQTNQFTWLDKATILPKDTTPAPWKVCTVTQVEEVKVLTRMLPILGSTIIMNTCLAQLQTFSVEQGSIMNRKLGLIEVPAPSIPIIPLLFMSVLIPVYQFVFVPFARKITKHPSGITQLQRVGVGLVLSAISMAVAGFIEVKRRNEAQNGHLLSVFWLSFQYGIFGIADMFTLVGLLEFFYKEAPVHMKSLSTSFTWLSLSFGYFLSSVFVSIINSVTQRITPSKQGWLHGIDLNKNNVNLFYWFLAILSCLNFANYLYWASWYKYKTDEPKQVLVQEESMVQESETIVKTNEAPTVQEESMVQESETIVKTNEAPTVSDQTEETKE